MGQNQSFSILFKGALLSLAMICSGLAYGQASLNINLLGTWTDPTIPLTSSGTRYSDVWGYAANGREYAMIGGSNGVHIIDVTAPSSPVRVAFEAGGTANTVWRDYDVYEHYLYAVSDQGPNCSLQIFDLTNLPVSVTKVYDSQVMIGRCHTITIDQGSGRLYCAGSPASPNGLVIMDLTVNPANPTLLGNFNLGGYVHDVAVVRDTLFAFFGGGISVGSFDLDDLMNGAPLAMIYTYPEQGFAHCGAVTEGLDYMYFCTELHNTGVHVADIRDPYESTHVSTFRSALLAPAHSNSVGHNPFIKDSILYISYYQDGLQMWDISNPAVPVKIAYFDTYPQNTDYTGYHGAWSPYPYLPSGNILVSDTENGLFVLRHINTFPVTITHFSGYKAEDKVHLSWRTESETNNRGFGIERSIDGLHFNEIGWVDGAGNSTATKDYSAIDSEPMKGRTYYRLRQVDEDGQSVNSQIVTIESEAELSLVSLFPSPVAVGGIMEVTIQNEKQQIVSFSVSNLLGQIVWSKQVEMGTGVQSVHIPTGNMASGGYILKVASNKAVSTQRFMVEDLD